MTLYILWLCTRVVSKCIEEIKDGEVMNLNVVRVLIVVLGLVLYFTFNNRQPDDAIELSCAPFEEDCEPPK